MSLRGIGLPVVPDDEDDLGTLEKDVLANATTLLLALVGVAAAAGVAAEAARPGPADGTGTAHHLWIDREGGLRWGAPDGGVVALDGLGGRIAEEIRRSGGGRNQSILIHHRPETPGGALFEILCRIQAVPGVRGALVLEAAGAPAFPGGTGGHVTGFLPEPLR